MEIGKNMNAIEPKVANGMNDKTRVIDLFENSDYINIPNKSMPFRDIQNEKDKRLTEQWLISKKKETFSVDPKDPARRSSLMPMYVTINHKL